MRCRSTNDDEMKLPVAPQSRRMTAGWPATVPLRRMRARGTSVASWLMREASGCNASESECECHGGCEGCDCDVEVGVVCGGGDDGVMTGGGGWGGVTATRATATVPGGGSSRSENRFVSGIHVLLGPTSLTSAGWCTRARRGRSVGTSGSDPPHGTAHSQPSTRWRRARHPMRACRHRGW